MMNEYVNMRIELPPVLVQKLRDEQKKRWQQAGKNLDTLAQVVVAVLFERFAEQHEWNVAVEEKDREGMER